MDSPYYIRHINYHHKGATYEIVSSGGGILCTAHGIDQARTIVDALNREPADEKESAAAQRRVHQGGDVPLADTAE